MAKQHQGITVKKMTMAVVATVGLVMIASSLILLGLFYKSIERSNQEKVDLHASAVVDQIGETISQVTTITNHLASSQQVRDLMALGAPEEIEAWAVRTRKLFPHTVGLSLITNEGDVIGDAGSQRVGRLCRRDLNIFLRKGHIPYPPVHRDNPRLEHFDLLKIVRDDEDGDAGLLLVSFHLDLIEGIIKRLSEKTHYYQLSSKDQGVLIEHGKQDLPYVIKHKLSGTDWELLVRADTKPSQQSVKHIIYGAVIMLMLLGILGFVISGYLKRVLVRDVEQLRQLLEIDNIHERNKLGSQSIKLHEIVSLVEDIEELSDELADSHEKLTQEAMTDALTGLGNRRSFEANQDTYYELAKNGTEVIVMALDIDYFKSINDKYGHAAGDQALTILGETLKESIRATDGAYRVGGDEALVIFTLCDKGCIHKWYQRIANKFSSELVQALRPEYQKEFTLSAGASRVTPDIDNTVEDALKRADEALYEAKQQGRNQLIANID